MNVENPLKGEIIAVKDEHVTPECAIVTKADEATLEGGLVMARNPQAIFTNEADLAGDFLMNGVAQVESGKGNTVIIFFDNETDNAERYIEWLGKNEKGIDDGL